MNRVGGDHDKQYKPGTERQIENITLGFNIKDVDLMENSRTVVSRCWTRLGWERWMVRIDKGLGLEFAWRDWVA